MIHQAADHRLSIPNFLSPEHQEHLAKIVEETAVGLATRMKAGRGVPHPTPSLTGRFIGKEDCYPTTTMVN